MSRYERPRTCGVVAQNRPPRTKNPGRLVHQTLRVRDVFQHLAGNDHVEVLRRVLRLHQAAVKHVEARRAGLPDGRERDLDARRLPPLLGGGLHKAARAEPDVQQPIVHAVPGELGDDLLQPSVHEIRRD